MHNKPPNLRQSDDYQGVPAHMSTTSIAQEDQLVVIKQSPFNAEAPLNALREDPTAIEHFYVRSNFGVPALTPQTWSLRVDGAVDNPFELFLDDLRSLPATTLVATLECAGNSRTTFAPLPKGEPWGLGALSTAEWRGVPLHMVLERVGLRSTVVELLFEGADKGTM